MAEELCARLFDFDPGRTDLKSLTRLLRARLYVEPVPIVRERLRHARQR